MPFCPASVSQGCGYGWAVANASLRLCVYRKQVGQSVCVRFEMLLAFCSSSYRVASHCRIWDLASVESRRSCHDGFILSQHSARVNTFYLLDTRGIRSCCLTREVAESLSLKFEMLMAFCSSSRRRMTDSASVESRRSCHDIFIQSEHSASVNTFHWILAVSVHVAFG